MDGLHTYNPVSLIAGGVDVSGVYSKVSGEVRDADKQFVAAILPGDDDRKIRTPGIL